MDVASYGKGDRFSEKLRKKLGNSKRLKEMELTKCLEKSEKSVSRGESLHRIVCVLLVIAWW